jgi:hypothetical protein
MSAVNDFMNQFDEDGRYEGRDGLLDVVFLTNGGRHLPGRLHFRQGLCVRAQVEGGGDWALTDDSPLMEVHFLLHFDGERPHGILINHGRVVQQYDKGIVKG